MKNDEYRELLQNDLLLWDTLIPVLKTIVANLNLDFTKHDKHRLKGMLDQAERHRNKLAEKLAKM